MSNTSMSLQNQSHMVMPDTDRGGMILIESGINLQEDSTMLNDYDEPREPMSAEKHEVLRRQMVKHD